MILNLTQHAATTEQVAEDVRDYPHETRAKLAQSLTFNARELAGKNPGVVRDNINDRARMLVSDFVLPALMKVARAFLQEGGYECSEIEAINIMRPGHITLRVMIGGAPYLMEPLAKELRRVGATPVYALSERISTEMAGEGGAVKKVAVFRHLGFVEA